MMERSPSKMSRGAVYFATAAILFTGMSTGFASTKKHSTKHKTSSAHHSSHNSHPSSHIPVSAGGSVLYAVQPGYTETGTASWYGGRDVGRKTANGETYRPTDVTAAHKRLPFNTLVRVTNLSNGKSTIVRINDRGPYIRGRIIDLSESSARRIDVYDRGVSKVKIEVVRAIPLMTQPNLHLSDLPKSTHAKTPSRSSH